MTPLHVLPTPLRTLPPSAHPPVIRATCMRAPDRLNRFVKGPRWRIEAPGFTARPTVHVFLYSRGTSSQGCVPLRTNPLNPSHQAYSGYPSHTSPPHRDNRAYVKTMCSFDSHQLISDPIKTQIRHCSTVKVSQIRLCTARGAALFILPITPDIPAPVAMAWGQGLRKQRAGADSGRMPGLEKEGPSVRLAHWSASAGGKCRQVRTLWPPL